MTTSHPHLRILLVEDEPSELEVLKRLISRKLPGTVIELAGCLADAKERIRGLAGKRQHYDAAILDYCLPVRPGEKIQGGRALPLLLPDFQGSIPVIIQFTAYPDQVSEEVDLKRLEDLRVSYEIIHKRDVGVLLERLVALAERLKHEAAVRHIEETVMRPNFDALIGYRGRLVVRDPSGGFDVGDFLAHCAEHWAFLPTHIQHKLRERFEVHEPGDGTATLAVKRRPVSEAVRARHLNPPPTAPDA